MTNDNMHSDLTTSVYLAVAWGLNVRTVRNSSSISDINTYYGYFNEHGSVYYCRYITHHLGLNGC